MKTLHIAAASGSLAELDADVLFAFSESLRGTVLTPEDDQFDECRKIWNAMIDRRPGCIVQCAGTADVIRSVNFAREHGLRITVRGAGHNIAGSCIADGAVMIDLSGMRSVHIDPETKRARVEPGATLGDLDHEAQQFGLALPVGINSTTGIAGLTLGGGFGWLSRKYGLTIDNLLSVDVVTASGELLHASPEKNSELFWGICGGGGNFGIVASFEFALHEIGTQVLSGLIVHPFSEASSLLRFYREFVSTAPDELTVWLVLRKAPPLPFLPEEVHGTNVVVIAALYAGDMAEGEAVLQPLRDFGNPHADVIGPHDYSTWQKAFDPLLTPGERNYWKSHDFTELSDGVLSLLLSYADALPDDQCEIFIAQMGGATARVPADATAYVHRDAAFIVNVHGRWSSAGDDTRCVDWCRALFAAAAPFATGGVYVNFMTEEEHDRVRDAYGSSYERLARLKSAMDPDNMFRNNQNIQPAA